MSILEAVLQGIIQGLTEFLPVSSSGHLSLYQHFSGNSGEGALLFSAVLHLGTLLAVFIAFRKTICRMTCSAVKMLRDIFTGNFRFKELDPNGRAVVMMLVSLLVLVPFMLFKDFFESVSQDGDIIIEGICFIYTSVLLFSSDKWGSGRKRFGGIELKDAVTVGAFQGVALLPGVSRSGSCIVGGLVCGFERNTAVEYSFILGIPAIAGGAVTETYGALSLKTELQPVYIYAVGAFAALLVGIAAIRLVKSLVCRERFRAFGTYTLILGAASVLIGVTEDVMGKGLIDIIRDMF